MMRIRNRQTNAAIYWAIAGFLPYFCSTHSDAQSIKYFVPVDSNSSGKNLANTNNWRIAPNSSATISQPVLGDDWYFVTNTTPQLYLNSNYYTSGTSVKLSPGVVDFETSTIGSVDAGDPNLGLSSTKKIYLVAGYSDPTYGQRTIKVQAAAPDPSNSSRQLLKWGVGLSGGQEIQTYLTGTTTIAVNSGTAIRYWMGGEILEQSGTTGSIVKQGNGELLFAPYTGSVTSQSSFSGGVTLNTGTILLGGNQHTTGYIDYRPLGTGTFTINGGTVGTPESGINIQAATSLANSIVINDSPTFMADGLLTFTGAVNLNGPSVTRTLTIGTTARPNGTISFTGGITNGGITKLGPSTLIIGGSNNSLESLSVTAGKLQLADTGFSSTAPAISVSSGATLALSSTSSYSFGTSSAAITGAGNFSSSAVGTVSLGGALAVSGNVTVGSGNLALTSTNLNSTQPAQFVINSASNLSLSSTVSSMTISSAVTGAGNLVLSAPSSGAITFSVSTSYTGNTTVNAGTATFQKVLGAIGSTGTTTIAAGANMIVGGPTASRLDSAALVMSQMSVALLGSSAATATLTAADSNYLFSTTNTYHQGVIVTSGLSMNSSGGALGSNTYYGKVDLSSNDMIIQGGGSNLATYNDMVRAGFNKSGPAWTGNGVTSSTAAAAATSSNAYVNSLYAIGIIRNSDPTGATAIYNTFDGVTVNNNSVLAKFTYYGDSDLSSVIDDTDYFAINNGYANGLTGWANGDFDYSGAVDDTDYFLINNAYGLQHTGSTGMIYTPLTDDGSNWWDAVIHPGDPFYDESVTFFETGYWPGITDGTGYGDAAPSLAIWSSSVPEPSSQLYILSLSGLLLLFRRK